MDFSSGEENWKETIEDKRVCKNPCWQGAVFLFLFLIVNVNNTPWMSIYLASKEEICAYDNENKQQAAHSNNQMDVTFAHICCIALVDCHF